MAKKKDEPQNVDLCEGIQLHKSFFDRRESRLFTLLIKGFTVYLLTMGSIGFYLSAMEIAYNEMLVHIIVLIMAFLCAFLYYRLLTENIGYFVLLVSFTSFVLMFKKYINSGFYAIVNITTDNAAQYFDIDVQRLYDEQIGNRYVSVTFIAVFIGIVLAIFYNVYISRRMQYMVVYFVAIIANLIPLYMIFEPGTLYTIMLLCGMALAYVYKSGQHYSEMVSVRRTDEAFKQKKKLSKKKLGEFEYVYDAKGFLQTGITVCIFIIAAIIAVSSFRPKETFNVGYKANKYKELSMAAVSIALTEGVSGFFKMSDDVGGINGGVLGKTGSVHLDHGTDLVVRVAPYDLETIYLKNFTGVTYNPYDNYWTAIENKDNYTAETAEADAYKEMYEANDVFSGRGYMMIKNVGVNPAQLYSPYYTKSVEADKYGYKKYEFYPSLAGNNTTVTADYYKDLPYTEADLYVPEANRDAVMEIIDNIGFIGDDESNIEAVKQYFQDNMEYTINPGKTPYGKDFVNNFLEDKQKGFCSYFASAAVLIYRQMGIPARYVEGYAVSFDEIINNGEIVEDTNYKDYYDGYSIIGNAALVQVNVTDADAHAWVEVYDSIKGWQVVDVTPTSEVEEESQDFWTMFDKIMTEDSGEGVEIEETDVDAGAFGRQIVRIICYIMAFLVLGFVAFILITKGKEYVKIFIIYKKSNTNDRLIIKYSQFIKRHRKRDKLLRTKINYEEQINHLFDMYSQNDKVKEKISTFDKNRIIDTLEKAGFSSEMISMEQYEYVTGWMKKL